MTKQTTFTQMFPGKSPAEIEAAKLRETLQAILTGAEGHVPLNNDWVCKMINAALDETSGYSEEEYQAYQQAQDDEYEERVRASYRNSGYHNIY